MTTIRVIFCLMELFIHLAIGLQVSVVTGRHVFAVEPCVGNVWERWEVHARLADHTCKFN